MSYQQSISCKGLHLHPIYNSAHVIDCALYSFRAWQAVDSEQLSVTAQNKVCVLEYLKDTEGFIYHDRSAHITADRDKVG